MSLGPNDLRSAAKALKSAAPEQWAAFIEIFGRYTDDVTVAVTDADAADIMTMKGRAQQCRALHRLYVECDRPVPQAALSQGI